MASEDSTYTPVEDIKDIHTELVQTFKTGVTRPLAYRRRQLLQLAHLFQDNHVALEDAILADIGKQRQECTGSEVAPVIQSALYAAEHLGEWAKPEKPKVEEWRSSWDATVYPVPKGVVLIISPWNYPYVLSFNPLVGAIAAGCPAVLKPSECLPTCSALMASLVPKYLDPAAYSVVLGAVHETEALLSLKWNHIFFTGSGRVGRIIAAKAGEQLTPLTLELGGKSPVIIDGTCDLELTAKRILFGKVQNSGQLCVSPDYVLVPRSVSASFNEAMKKAYTDRFPQGALHPDAKWSRIINPVQSRRLKDLMNRSKGKILVGGQVDGEQRIAPTIFTDVKLDDALMEDEIFGPLLPLIEVEDAEEAVRIISDRPSPLVIYLFSARNELRDKLLNYTNSGSIVMNDTIMNIAVYELPFGGHGDSGYGSYYGKDTFDTFTHRRSYINVPNSFELNYAYRYLPYTDDSYRVMTAGAHVKIPDA